MVDRGPTITLEHTGCSLFPALPTGSLRDGFPGTALASGSEEGHLSLIIPLRRSLRSHHNNHRVSSREPFRCSVRGDGRRSLDDNATPNKSRHLAILYFLKRRVCTIIFSTDFLFPVEMKAFRSSMSRLWGTERCGNRSKLSAVHDPLPDCG